MRYANITNQFDDPMLLPATSFCSVRTNGMGAADDRINNTEISI
jgi:hypothetical protein